MLCVYIAASLGLGLGLGLVFFSSHLFVKKRNNSEVDHSWTDTIIIELWVFDDSDHIHTR